MKDEAIKYAKFNIPIMLLHHIGASGSCSCKNGLNCKSKGKHPIYSRWYENATTDIEQIKSWWRENPDANIGIPTGEKSGWLVLDVDDGGDSTLADLESINSKLPKTITAITGSGGRHYIFKYPVNRNIPNRTKFAKGLDTRSTGGLIVVSPSNHVSGNRYSWMVGCSPFDINPVEAPEWLLKLMEKAKNFEKPKNINSLDLIENGDSSKKNNIFPPKPNIIQSKQ